jgi:hypothetical protein
MAALATTTMTRSAPDSYRARHLTPEQRRLINARLDHVHAELTALTQRITHLEQVHAQGPHHLTAGQPRR